MKRIGILTFHYADNYGAVLQAWALRKCINQLQGCKAEIINYVPDGYCIYPYEQSRDGIEKIKGKRRAYENFLYDHCGIHSPMIHRVVGNEYDYYCVGSDQVWDFNLRENRDLEYLLPNLDDEAVRFSYAASLKKGSFDGKEHLLREYFPKFKEISLREQSFMEKVKELYGQEVVNIIDPTLLLQSFDYEDLINPTKFLRDKYLFFFAYPLGKELRKYVPIVNTLARKYNLKVLHTCMEAPKYMFANNAGCVMYEGIENFLWYMKHAEFIVTTSYHGVVFSILFQKPFYSIIREQGKERILDLMQKLNLNNRIATDYMPADVLSDYVEYEGVNKILEKERIKAVSFLKKVLDVE